MSPVSADCSPPAGRTATATWSTAPPATPAWSRPPRSTGAICCTASTWPIARRLRNGWCSPRAPAPRRPLQALGSLASYHEARAEDGPALDYTFRQLALEPWREEATRQAMRLLAARGQRSAALAQYDTCRHVLAAELHAEAERRDDRPLRAAQSASAGRRPPRCRPAPAPRITCPRQLTPFIGREDELRLLIERLDSLDTGLLTLVGPGGVGKTRLAWQAASAQVGRVPRRRLLGAAGGDHHARPAPGHHRPSGRLPVRARSRSPRATPPLPRDKDLLLVLDNFEQLQSSPAATDLLLSILQTRPA